MADSPEPERELDGEAASKALTDAFASIRGGQRGGKTALQEEASRPLTAQRRRAEALLWSFGIGPRYILNYTEAANAMQLFARDEMRPASVLLDALDKWALHAMGCAFGPDECPDCRELFASKAAAYQAWKAAGKPGASR